MNSEMKGRTTMVPRSHEEAARMNRNGADLLKARNSAKDAAARIDPGRDASTMNAQVAKGKQWVQGSFDQRLGKPDPTRP